MPPTIIPRADWGAKPTTGRTRLRDFSQGWFAHWLGEPPAAGKSDAQVLRDTQRYHQDTRRYTDIAYSFAIGPERPTVVYECRGWGIVGGHTENYNTTSMALVFLIGQGQQASPQMLRTAAEFIRSAPAPYTATTMRPHGAVKSTACPGPQLTKWLADGLPLPDGEDPMYDTLAALGSAMATVDELYRHHREGQPPTELERASWARDIRGKLLKGEDIRATLAYIDWALGQEG